MNLHLWQALAAQLVWARPWALWLLLPLLWPSLRRRLGAQQAGMAPSLLHPGLHGLLHPTAPRRRLDSWRRWAAWLSWTCWVLALARPQWQGVWLQEAPLGRDIVVVLDTSLTMSIDDWRWNNRPAQRLDVVKQVFADFARQRAGDRFGLIAFGSQAATLLAPTQDSQLVAAMLQRARVGMLGQDTALGDALGLALRQIKRRNGLPPLLIVYSDNGPSNSGQLSPAQALALARALGVMIDTVQVGDTPARGSTYAVPAYAGPQPDLRLLAEASGGQYFDAADSASLQAAVESIGRLAPTVRPPPRQHSMRDLYPWLLAIGIVLSLLSALPHRQRRMR